MTRKEQRFVDGIGHLLQLHAERCGFTWDQAYTLLHPENGKPWKDRNLDKATRTMAQFSHALLKILHAYESDMQDQEEQNYTSTPVMDSEEARIGAVELRAIAEDVLIKFEWDALNSENYETARSAQWRLDNLKYFCFQFPDLKQQAIETAKSYGIEL